MPTLGRNTSFHWRCTWSHNWWTFCLSSKLHFLSGRAEPLGLTCSPWRFLVPLGRGSTNILALGEPKQEGSTNTALSCQRPLDTHLSIQLGICKFANFLACGEGADKVVKGLLVVKLLFRCHFQINVADKVGVGHSMPRLGGRYALQEASSHYPCSHYGPFSSP